jgi:fructose-1,6-bisphosphatase/inositol monophosphatase family enzyme
MSSDEAEKDLLNVVDIFDFELKKLENIGELIKKEVKLLDSKIEIRIKKMNDLVNKIEKINENIILGEENIRNFEVNMIDLEKEKILLETIRHDRDGLLSMNESYNRELEVSKLYFFLNIKI